MRDFFPTNLAVLWIFGVVAVTGIGFFGLIFSSGWTLTKNNKIVAVIALVIGLLFGGLCATGAQIRQDNNTHQFHTRCDKLHGTVVGTNRYCIKGKVLFDAN